MLYYFVYRPIRREGRLSWDGMFFICALGMVWQDQLQNVFGYHVLVNTEFINWGSWYNFIPGWLPDQRTLAEPVVWITIWYGYAILFGAIATNWVMRKAKQRWPSVGNVGLVGICFTLLFVVLVPMEIAYMALGMYTYPSAIEELTLFHGHYYQYPLYEAFLYSVFWTACSCLRYYRNDRGESIAERGISNVKVSQKKRNGLRFLAMWGVMNIAYISLYNLPVAMVGGLHPDTFPEDIQKRSYFVQQVCGEGTGYACPGEAVPLQHGNSAHLDENGRLIVPEGVKLPTSVPYID